MQNSASFQAGLQTRDRLIERVQSVEKNTKEAVAKTVQGTLEWARERLALSAGAALEAEKAKMKAIMEKELGAEAACSGAEPPPDGALLNDGGGSQQQQAAAAAAAEVGAQGSWSALASVMTAVTGGGGLGVEDDEDGWPPDDEEGEEGGRSQRLAR
eukprot:COSAG01_NODE_10087_length_2253_cov_1.245125_2_plen_156_part_01